MIDGNVSDYSTLGVPVKVRSDRFIKQFDHQFGEYIEKVKSRYAPRIGLFFIRFSSLEHAFDIYLAERISDREHHSGYIVIEGMPLNGRIDLFRKLFAGFVRATRPRNAARLKAIVKRLHAARVFRNYVAHANWSTLENSGYVRTRIDEDDGEIVFKRVRITPKVINAWIRRVSTLERDLDEFVEGTQHA
jgi:hypothetical protein